MTPSGEKEVLHVCAQTHVCHIMFVQTDFIIERQIIISIISTAACALYKEKRLERDKTQKVSNIKAHYIIKNGCNKMDAQHKKLY